MEDPLSLFDRWLIEATESEPAEPNAMALATADADGMPSCRIVLLKERDGRDFVFYTDERSQKGRDLARRPYAALCFHWRTLQRQVRISGPVSSIPDDRADAYFASRSAGSKIGATLSVQSHSLGDLDDLFERHRAQLKAMEPDSIKRPLHWRGYRVEARRIEFWSEGQFRLHERRLFERTSSGWSSQLLYP